MTRTPAGNSGFKKLAVKCLNEHLFFVSSALLAGSFVLRNRQLLKPANRHLQCPHHIVWFLSSLTNFSKIKSPHKNLGLIMVHSDYNFSFVGSFTKKPECFRNLIELVGSIDHWFNFARFEKLFHIC